MNNLTLDRRLCGRIVENIAGAFSGHKEILHFVKPFSDVKWIAEISAQPEVVLSGQECGDIRQCSELHDRPISFLWFPPPQRQ
jgi:hypothetical protein